MLASSWQPKAWTLFARIGSFSVALISVRLPSERGRKNIPGTVCLIFARIAPGIAFTEEVLLWTHERENFWTRPGYALFGGR
jgi:hypothetical protein